MAHPDLEHAVAHRGGVVLNAFKQGGVSVRANISVPKLALVPAGDHAAQLVRHSLHAVANPQDRNTQLKYHLRRFVGAFLVNTGVAAGQNNALQTAVTRISSNPVFADITGMNFAKHMGFTNTTGNELSDLRTEVKNENFLMHF